MNLTYEPTVAAHLAALADIADATLFPGEMLPDMIAPFLDGAEGELWLTALRDGAPVGFTLTRAEDLADAAWNMKALAVKPDLHRGGIGRGLVAATEAAIRETGGRLMVVDTSSDPAQIPAVAFYLASGYRLAANVPDFWADGEDRLTFTKLL